jgi:hypothetical protein
MGDETVSGPEVNRIRDLHVDIDEAVMESYGWQDIDLNYGYYDSISGSRYTVSPEAQAEVLDRLLELNHQRYAEEVGAGLHQDAGATPPPKTRTRRDPDAQMLFEEGE